jgi:hypothetical protein
MTAIFRIDLAKQIDPYTDSMMVIDRLVTMIFLGNMYSVSSYFTLNTDGVMEFLIEAPEETGAAHHVWFGIHGSLNFNAHLFEATTKEAVPANAVPAINRNRTSENTCNLDITHTPTGSGDGNLIYSNQWGSDAGPGGISGEGGSLSESHQWVLKPGEKYLVRITSTQDLNRIGVSANIVHFTSEENTYVTKELS